MADEVRRARIRAFPPVARRTGLPSAGSEITRLERIFGSIPIAPDLRRSILRRRLDEIDEQLDDWKGEPEDASPLIAERDKVAKEVESLGGSSEHRPRPPRPEDALGAVDEDHPVVALSVGPSWRERFR
jgi:hypothetical protein